MDFTELLNAIFLLILQFLQSLFGGGGAVSL